MSKIILASESPRRKEIIKSLGFSYSVCRHNFDELSINELDPVELCKKIAHGKAQTAFNLLKNQLDLQFHNNILIAADTLVFCEDKIFGKPKNIDDAKKMIQHLSGNKHDVVTALSCIQLNTSRILETYCISSVFFKNMNSDEIEFYLNTNEWRGVAGSYRIQGCGAFFIKRIDGSYSNIVGLPIFELYEILKEFKFKF